MRREQKCRNAETLPINDGAEIHKCVWKGGICTIHTHTCEKAMACSDSVMCATQEAIMIGYIIILLHKGSTNFVLGFLFDMKLAENRAGVLGESWIILIHVHWRLHFVSRI